MKIAIAVLFCTPLLAQLGCGPRKIYIPESLDGLDEVHLSVISPYEEDKEYDSLRIWQKALIAESLEKHGIHIYKPKTDFKLPKRFLEYETRITSVFPDTQFHHYLVRMRLHLTERANIKRPDRTINMPATTWDRNYVAWFTDERDIISYLKVSTENMLIEFENFLIEDNPDRLSGFEKRPYIIWEGEMEDPSREDRSKQSSETSTG